MYSHIVMFTLKDKDDIPQTVGTLQAMEGRIPQLRYIEVGVDDAHGLAAKEIYGLHAAGCRHEQQWKMY